MRQRFLASLKEAPYDIGEKKITLKGWLTQLFKRIANS